MNDIYTRYGATVPLTVVAEDAEAVSASLYVGKAGETAVITTTANFENLVADLTVPASDSEVPLGEYRYQINVTYADGTLDKYPAVDGYTDQLPSFHVLEALDETEVTA